VKRWWPAAFALVALIVVYFVMRSHHDDVAHETQVANQAPPPATPPSGPPPSVPPPAQQGSEGQGSDAAGELDDHQGSGPIYGSAAPHEVEDAPPEGSKKPKLTLDEKLAETAKHIEVMKKRSQLLEKEIADLQKAGKTKEAQEQQVVLDRLKDHMKKLQTAIDEHKEPM